jgi:hypothetical protein
LAVVTVTANTEAVAKTVLQAPKAAVAALPATL